MRNLNIRLQNVGVPLSNTQKRLVLELYFNQGVSKAYLNDTY